MVRDGKREKKIFLERKRRGEGSRREDFLEGEEKREARGYGCTYSRRMRVSVYCSECLARIELPEPLGAPAGSVSCPSEHSSIAFSHSDAVRGGERVDVCSRCVSTALFSQKDFDQRLGCAILAAGAAVALGVSWRFGGVWFVPVLLLVAAADLVLARRVAAVVICYQCDTEYRGVADASATRSYDPHVAERFADVKTVRRMNP
jgi:hypothetical protein